MSEQPGVENTENVANEAAEQAENGSPVEVAGNGGEQDNGGGTAEAQVEQQGGEANGNAGTDRAE